MVPRRSHTEPFLSIDWLCPILGFTEVKRSDRDENNLIGPPEGPDSGS